MSITEKENLPTLTFDVPNLILNQSYPSLAEQLFLSDSEDEVKPTSAKRKLTTNRIKKPVMPAKIKVQEQRKLISLYEIHKKPNSAVTIQARVENKSGNPVMPPPAKKQRQIENSSKSIRHSQKLAYQPQPIISKILNPQLNTKRAKKVNNKSLLKKSFKIANNYLSRFNK